MPQLGLHQQIGGGAGKFWNADFTSFRLTFNLHNLYYVKYDLQKKRGPQASFGISQPRS